MPLRGHPQQVPDHSFELVFVYRHCVSPISRYFMLRLNMKAGDLKRWLMVMLPLAIFLSIGWAVAHSVRNRSKENQHTQDHAANSKPLVTQVRSVKQEDPTQNQPHDWHYWKEAFYPGTWSNWALAVFGAWAGYMALMTLRAIKEQSDIMMNKERARLRIEVLPLNYA